MSEWFGIRFKSDFRIWYPTLFSRTKNELDTLRHVFYETNSSCISWHEYLFLSQEVWGLISCWTFLYDCKMYKMQLKIFGTWGTTNMTKLMAKSSRFRKKKNSHEKPYLFLSWKITLKVNSNIWENYFQDFQ